MGDAYLARPAGSTEPRLFSRVRGTSEHEPRTPWRRDWVERIRADFEPYGYNHIVLGLIDPYLVERWSGRRLGGLPDLASQLELFSGQVMPALSGENTSIG